MKNLKSLLMLALLITILAGCAKESFAFPTDKDFSLTATPSKTSVAVGESFDVKAEFKNLTNNKYKLSSAQGFVNINVVELNEPETTTPSSTEINVQPNQTITVEAKGFKLDKAGNYRAYAVANFEITDPKTGQKKIYSIHADDTLIEVR